MIITAYVGGGAPRKGRANLCDAPMTNEELLLERVAKLEVQRTYLNETLNDTKKSRGGAYHFAASQRRSMGERGACGVAGCIGSDREVYTMVCVAKLRYATRQHGRPTDNTFCEAFSGRLRAE